MTSNIHLSFDLSPDNIRSLCQKVIDEDVEALNEIAALNENELNEVSVLQRLSVHSAKMGPTEDNVGFLKFVHPSKEIREVSSDCEKRLSEHNVEMQMRKDVFDNLLKLQKSEIGQSLKGETKRYMDRLVKNGLQNGLHLDEAHREEIKAIKKRLSDISITFEDNVNEENTKFEFTADQLKGVPDDFLKPRAKDKGDSDIYVVSLKYPDYFPVMKLCMVGETRRALQTAFDSRCKDQNAKLLEEAVELRAKRAKLLGYSCHADYVLELRMAKKQENVQKFLDDLSSKLKPLVKKEFEQFLTYKKEDSEKYGFDYDGKINMWDFRFYMNKVAQLQYSVDHEKLKEYFPVNVVTAGLLEIYQSLLHLKFVQVKDTKTWHPDVTLYEARESSNGQIAGYFFLDLYPREGKYNHAAVFKLQSYYEFPDGTLQYPVCAMVANFPQETPDLPALFTHDDVETFFHEFGHVMHNVCARTQYDLFAGTRVERDFVEAPSQMLENWVWCKESLSKMSKHYKDGSKIPDDLLQKLVESRKANAGIFNLRQVMLSAFDQTIHVKVSSSVLNYISRQK